VFTQQKRERGKKRQKPETEKERKKKALQLLSAAYTRIFEQQEELHTLKLERLETNLRKEHGLQMSASKQDKQSRQLESLRSRLYDCHAHDVNATAAAWYFWDSLFHR
jgi:acyl-homoserine lactone acylase PvdQ